MRPILLNSLFIKHIRNDHKISGKNIDIVSILNSIIL